MNAIIKYLISTITDRNSIAVAIAWLVGYIGVTVTQVQLGELVNLVLQIISALLVFLPAKFIPILGKPITK